MTTERQAEANRRNAMKSTGPRTPEGKAVVALNGMKHGLLSRESLVKGENEADGVGFEPTRRSPACRFSRPVPSTTRPPIHSRQFNRSCEAVRISLPATASIGGWYHQRQSTDKPTRPQAGARLDRQRQSDLLWRKDCFLFRRVGAIGT